MRIALSFKRAQRRGRRGIVLITTMWIAIALAAVVLVLCREMQVEQLTAVQHLAQAKADAAEIGVEQLVMSIVEQELVSPGYKDQVSWQQREMGECYFWVFKPNQTDEGQPDYGLTDEASKLDINYSSEPQLEMLPGIDPAIAAAIVDWRDADDLVTVSALSGAQGAESDFYDATYGYRAKNANFETLDELRLVMGLTATDEPAASVYLYGADTNHNAIVESNELANADTGMSFETTRRGIMPYLTVYGYQATNPAPLSVTSTGATTGTGTVTTTTTPLTTTTVTNTGSAITVAVVATDTTINNVYYGATPTTLTDISSTIPIDVNLQTSQQLLQQLLQMAAPNSAQNAFRITQQRVPAAAGGRGGGAAATPFKNIWDWIVSTGLTSQDLSSVNTPSGEPLFCVLTCNVATVTQNLDPNTGLDTTTGLPPNPVQFAKLNMNTASVQAIMALPGNGNASPYTGNTSTTATGTATDWVPAFTQEDAENIITYRDNYLAGLDSAQVPNISWLLDAIDPTEYPQLAAAGNMLTGTSTIFSADIVTVTQDGRAFKRVKIVVDDSSGIPVIISRRDLTDAGWPMDPAVRTALRTGQPINATSGPSPDAATPGGRLTFGQ